MTDNMTDKQTISVDHITIRSRSDFSTVKSKLESTIPRIDDGIFTLLRYHETARALSELKALPALSIFSFRDHGVLLQVAGLECRAMQYDIGNPLTASMMTRHRISAGLYAPVRVLLREENGEVAFEYDRPLTTFGQFGDPDIIATATQLDIDLHAALETAAR